ncbi:MAG: hypothetical protein JSW00_18685 [Thermoplasmata archaeon]|nr:MAG: hypothetical protein JSW00_18685 [Thermoplasmata archaeon]
MSDENRNPNWENPNSVLEIESSWIRFQRSGRGDPIPRMMRQKRSSKRIR